MYIQDVPPASHCLHKKSVGGILKYPNLLSTFYEKTIWLTLKIFAFINVTQLQSHTIPGTVSVYIIIIIKQKICSL